MAALGIVDARTNPNDSSQRVELWGNGRIDTYNTAPITAGPPADWFVRLDLPVAVAIWIVDWVTMAGYVLDGMGGFWPINGAPNFATSKPDWFDGPNMIVDGVPYQKTSIFKDWTWDPNNPGRGIVLDGYGTLHEFGGAPQSPRPFHRWTQSTIARKLVARWPDGGGVTDLRVYTMDYSGGIHHDYAAAPAPGITRALQPQLRQAGDFPYWLRQDMARDFIVTDWDSTPAGYTMNKHGRVYEWGGAEPAIGYPRNTGGDWARKLLLLTPDNPARFRLIGNAGQSHEWVASTRPVVTAGGFTETPANPTTDTSRPVLAWSYSDAQQDDQAEVRVLVFTAAFVSSHTMTDPEVHAAAAVVDVSTTDPDTRGIQSPIDLLNDDYRMYVRARDTADQWSPWASRAWTQNVPPPATPTGLTAVANDDATVTLSATADPNDVAELVRLDRSDDDGVTWAPVDGADAVPIAATVTAVDRFPPQGVDCQYRAVAYAIDPRTASEPSNVATATITPRGYLIHARNDVTAGGELRVQEPVVWTREFAAGVFQGLGAVYPTVVKDGSGPTAAKGVVQLLSLDAAAWATIESIALSDSTLVYRDPYGKVRYCEVVGAWPQALMEGSGLRHRHTTELSLVEVRPPHLPA